MIRFKAILGKWDQSIGGWLSTHGQPALERLRLLAEHRFQAVTDYHLLAMGGPSETSH
jgi:hypothetical protein